MHKTINSNRNVFYRINNCHNGVPHYRDISSGSRLWWIFLLLGLACIAAALFVESIIGSAALGIIGASLLWSIGELFEQKERVRKGWFPMNPKRKHEYGKSEEKK